MNLTRGEYAVSDDPSRLDFDAIYEWLRATYWAADRSRETMRTAFEHSVCFGVFQNDRQVGFGRVITDRATYNYLCDIIIAPEHRGRGLGKWLVESMLAHPTLQSGPVYLRTRDAHALYRPFGFKDSQCMRLGAGEDLCLPPGKAGC